MVILLNLFIFLLVFLVVVLAVKPVQFLNGGYRGIVIAIHSDVPESEQLIYNLEELLRKSSAFLYKATDGRARFVEFEVIIPETWTARDDYESVAGSHYDRAHIKIAATNPKIGDEPYTYQPRGCGEPGEYIRLTDAFIEELKGRTEDEFGSPEKHFIHEWAHYRYGVFDEYGIVGDSKYPTFYMENGTVYPTTCVKGIKGRQEDRDGKPCKIYSGGRVDPKCQFIPHSSDNEVLASIMFMPHIQSIEKFCQNGTNDPKLVHNKYAPNKQNILCNYKSTSEVIEEHPDFRNLDRKLLSDKYYEPTIRLLRVDEKQSSRFVLLLDVSGSMKDNGRIRLLNRAATRFVRDLIPNYMQLGIIEFETVARIVHKMVTVNDTTRLTLNNAIPSEANGWTAIGKGFKLTLEILRENGGDTRGATIILVSDGEENQKEPTIEEIIPEIIKAGVRVEAIAVAVEADKRLENITAMTGGRTFYMRDDDNATNTVMETAFMGFVSQQSNVEVQPVTIMNRHLIVIMSGRSVYKKVIIDSELGKNTKFTFSSNDVDVMAVKIKSPEGQIFSEGHPYLRKESQLKLIELLIPNSEVGHWEVIFDNDIRHNKDIVVALSVTSEPKNPRHQPIRVNAYFGKLEVRYPSTALIYAEVKKGENVIIGAKVVAVVERPGNGRVEVYLYDDGSGMDVSANDGVYTTAFTQFTGNGRYSVSAKVESDSSQTRIRTTRNHYSFSRSSRRLKTLRNGSNDLKTHFDVKDFIAASGVPNDDFESESIPEFTRVTEAGAFKLEDYRPEIDLIPPGRVTNLRVITIDEEDQIVEIQWTAPGDDAFTGIATKIDLRSSLSQETLNNPDLFQTAVSIGEDTLVAGSLEPSNGGSQMRAKFQIPRILLKFGQMSAFGEVPKISIYLALRAMDDSNNTGHISNIAFVHFGYVKPVFDNIIIGTNSRPFETTVIQTHIVLPNPVLFYQNRILLQKYKNQIPVRIPKELGRNTKFIITSDDIEILTIKLLSPNGTTYGLNGNNYNFDLSEMMVNFQIALADPGKWKVRFEKRRKETVIAYLSVTSESRVDEPVKVKAWMDTPFMAEDKPPNAVINAEVIKRYNYVICADVLAVVDRPKGEPIVIQLHDNGLGADKVPNDGLYSGVFAKFNTNGRYGVTARVINNNKAMLKLGVEDEKLKCR